MDYFTQISNNWFWLQKDHTNSGDKNLISKYKAKGLYLYIRIASTLNIRGKVVFNKANIQEWFNNPNSRDLKNIYKILQTFKDDKMFDFEKDYDFTVTNATTQFVANYNDAIFDSGHWFQLYDDELDKIMGYQGNEDKYKLLSVFGELKSRINQYSLICYPTYHTMALDTGITENSIRKYVDILRDIGLILYDNAGTKLFKDGSIRECANTYTMNYEGNKEILNDHIMRYKQEVIDEGTRLLCSKNANKKRSITQKMNWLEVKYKEGIVSNEEYEEQKTQLAKFKSNLKSDYSLDLETGEIYI